MKSRSIRVGNRKYIIVELCDEDFDLVLSKKGVVDEDVKSFIDYDDQLICVRDRLKPDHRQELIIHELLHACIEDAGVEQDDATERFIRAMSPRLSLLMSSGLHELFDV